MSGSGGKGSGSSGQGSVSNGVIKIKDNMVAENVKLKIKLKTFKDVQQ